MPGPELGCQYFVVRLCLRLEGGWHRDHSLGSLGLQVRTPVPQAGSRFPPMTITDCVLCARAGPRREGSCYLAEGWGPPAAWQRVGFSVMELQVDGTRGSSTVPCVTLVTEPLFLVQRGSSSPRSSKRPQPRESLPSASHATDRDEICFYKYK